MTVSAYSLNSHDWKNALEERGLAPTLVKFWVEGLYRNSALWERHISHETLSELRGSFDMALPSISKSLEASDGTVKFQMRFSDGLEAETVLIPFHKRFTVCLSTQVGCGMNCSFCYTGTQGLKRNLTAGEIVGQYLVAYQWLLKKQEKALKPSVVFMGQGEPLHNADNVKKAIEILMDHQMVGVGHRQMTLSTVGYLPGFEILRSMPRINIAFSLHSPFQEERTKLIPLSQRYPLSQVMTALDEVPLLKRQFITYEYLLIKNLNMTDAHVEALAELLGSRKALVNLIPFNPFPEAALERPDDSEIEAFRLKLVAKKLRVMVRTTKGDDILAACGQLKIDRFARNYDKDR